ncbi:MAG TPA: phosphate ABC transporter permease subunit PstC [Candidatus Thermoplasmatota archaeon]|nr:phosphate ABC transporter permease subunit PstC [Candidatus Thermoplasmatota archaeon]
MADTGDRIFAAVTLAAALAVAGLFAYLLWTLAAQSAPTWRAAGPGFFVSQQWDPAGDRFGALAYLFGTVASSAIALAVAVPVALGTAVALAILLPRWLAAPLGMFVELLAAVPSIIFGIWGLFTVVPLVHGLSGGTATGRSLLAAGIVLAVMIVPIITAVARDMVRAVPLAQREAALALGLTPWEVTWKVVLPYARPGLLAAILLGLGRAMGETMAVIMVIGNRAAVDLNVFAPAATMASVIANEFGEPSNPLHASSLVALGLVMLALSLGTSLLGRWIVQRSRRPA